MLKLIHSCDFPILNNKKNQNNKFNKTLFIAANTHSKTLMVIIEELPNPFEKGGPIYRAHINEKDNLYPNISFDQESLKSKIIHIANKYNLSVHFLKLEDCGRQSISNI